MSTAIIYSDEYLKHNTGNHPERPERYHATLGGLMADEDLWNDLVKIAPRAATDEELRCHAERVVKRVEQACSQAALYDHVSLDADTVVSQFSEVAARLAAGACRAVEAVVGGEAETAFVACRPPGHHATPGLAMGFCLYNNVAVAARYAQAAYPDRIQKSLSSTSTFITATARRTFFTTTRPCSFTAFTNTPGTRERATQPSAARAKARDTR